MTPLLQGALGTLGAAGGVMLGSLLGGIPLGALAAFGRGTAEGALARATEIAAALPAVVVLPLLAARLGGTGFVAFVVVVGTLRLLEVARVVRAELLRASSEEFASAARAIGASTLGLWWRHLLPHVLRAALVSAAFAPAAVVALDAALGLAGFGMATQPASWGAQLAAAAARRAPEEMLAPGLAALVATATLQLLAELAARALRGPAPNWVATDATRRAKPSPLAVASARS